MKLGFVERIVLQEDSQVVSKLPCKTGICRENSFAEGLSPERTVKLCQSFPAKLGLVESIALQKYCLREDNQFVLKVPRVRLGFVERTAPQKDCLHEDSQAVSKVLP